MPTTVYGFITKFERNDHFQFHGREFSPAFASAEDYEAAAIAFLTCPLTDTMLEGSRRNGDVIRFNRATDEFAICDRDGVLKTYYEDPRIHKQRDNVAYFEGQCLK